MTLSHPALPPPASRPWLAVAAAVWMVVALFVPESIPEPLPSGRHALDGVLVSDVIEGRYGSWALAETGDFLVLLDLAADPGLLAGDRIRFEGVADGVTAVVRGRWHSSTIAVSSIETTSGPGSAPIAVGNAVRQHVIERLRPFDDGKALLAGFLIGDTSELDRSDVEAMRLSGLSHFVAVSGSNVALFLILLALASGPLALGPRRRAVIGLVGLPVYAAATRFEPSVMRASVMAGIALAGRLFGVVLEAWQVLALAVTVLLVVDPSMTGNVGFQLSVAATAGVLVGVRWPIGGGKVQRSLMVTGGAQLAVAPLLLAHFGSVPLLSPVINLVAAPIVAVSTMLGAVGVTGLGFLTDIAAGLAGLVLSLARGASTWPQVGAGPLVAMALTGLLVMWLPAARVTVALIGAGLALMLVVGTGEELPELGVVVLDVGQGDSILIHGGQGRFALVDGGPDPAALISRLRAYGVTGLDLVVVTHVHADHVAGLIGLVGQLPVGEVWVAFEPHQTSSSRELVSLLEVWGISMHTPRPGEIRQLGGVALEVVAPLRRYASPNDQSIVLMAEGPARSMLLSGDIEVVAQRELTGLRADVLKVPHQGAATSNPDWLAGIGASLAAISVGPNSFGHPAQWVTDLLEESGATVIRTDHAGDVPIDLAEPHPGVPALTWAGNGRLDPARRCLAPAGGSHLCHGGDQRLPGVEEHPHRGPLGRRGVAHGGSLPKLGSNPHRSRRPIVALRQPNHRDRRRGVTSDPGGRSSGGRGSSGRHRHLETGGGRDGGGVGSGHHQRHRWPGRPCYASGSRRDRVRRDCGPCRGG